MSIMRVALLGALATFALAGCGSGDLLLTPGDRLDATISSVSLLSGNGEVSTDADASGEGLTVSAVVRDANNNPIPGVTVFFASDSGLITPLEPVTNNAGVATAELTTPGDPRPRTIRVFAQAGNQVAISTITAVQPPEPASFQIGTLENGVFTPGVIDIGQTPLSSGGSSGITVDIVDANDPSRTILFEPPLSVTFNSRCADQGLATLVSPATTALGRANTTYTAQGCSGSDEIIATTTVNDQVLTARGTITLLAATVGAIEFVSATPTVIGLRGSGQPETSVVVFRVNSSTGGPIVGEPVSFALSTTVGGLAIEPTSAVSDADGLVQTIVRSGTVHTAVRVIASVNRDGTVISSQSGLLTVTTGIADQDSVSLSTAVLNPAGFSCDGITVPISIRAADRFNNPVPDDTAFAITTEGGSIVGSCQTSGGDCVVNWTSQDPRPSNGRSTILVTAIGEESFIDTNGNGRFDDSEWSSVTDLPEAFLDRDEDGVRDGNEEFLDFDGDGQYDGANALFTGGLCNGPTRCDSRINLHVRDSLVLVMSGQVPVVTPLFTVPFITTDDSTLILQFIVKDQRGQPLPIGTTVSLELPSGVSVDGTASYVVPSTNNASDPANTYTFVVETGDNLFVDGLIKLKVSAPSACGAVETLTNFAFRSNTACTDGVNNDANVPGTDVDGTSINKGDNFIDAADAGCLTASGEYDLNSDSELSACQDGINNDSAEGTDAEDPDCHFQIKDDINNDGDFDEPGEVILGDFNPQINEEAATVK